MDGHNNKPLFDLALDGELAASVIDGLLIAFAWRDDDPGEQRVREFLRKERDRRRRRRGRD